MKKIYLLIALLITNVFFGQSFHDTKGELQISNSGTASYNVPIALPPSINDVAPVINLTYSSGARGGIAGQGWNINSISTISRMATRRDIDGFVDGVDFDDNDKLALDGQRLLLKTGTYWANGSTYETEYKSNTKIELKVESGKTLFIITSPDGSRAWYGSKGSGTYQNAISVNAWHIVHFEDTYGTIIDYDYSIVTYNSTNQLYIDTITFSGNTSLGIAAQNKIQFFYDNAKRVERDYLNGVPIYATKILNNIKVYANNTLFRRYQLSKTTDSFGYERVTQVQEYNAQDEASNPVVFTYEITSATTDRKVKDYTNNLNFSKTDLAGDFDGDGRLDFVADNKVFINLFNENSGNAGISLPFTTDGFNEFTASIISNNKLNQTQSIVQHYNYNYNKNSNVFNVYNLVNGIVQLNYTKQVVTDTYDFPVHRNDLDTFEPIIDDGYYDFSQDICFINEPSSSEIPKLYTSKYVGDFNGDGITDVLMKNVSFDYFYDVKIGFDENNNFLGYNCQIKKEVKDTDFFMFDLNESASTTIGSKGLTKLVFDKNSDLFKNIVNLSEGSVISKTYIQDFNGDGKSDILSIRFDKTYSLFSFKYLDSAPWVETEIIAQGTLDKYTDNKQILMGDYNGDGKVDLMIPDTEGTGPGQTLWHIYYSNPKPTGGEMFVKETHTIAEYWPNTKTYYDSQTHFSNYYAIDINGDGKSDLVRVWRKYYKPSWTINDHNTQWWVTTFTNNIGNTTNATPWTLTFDSDNLNIHPIFGPQHFNSDSPDIPIPITSNYRYQGANTDLVIVRGHYNKIEYYKFNKNVEAENRLKTVSESNGNIVQTIDYLPMEAANYSLGIPATDFYSSTNSATYPNIEIIRNSFSYLVSKLTAKINNVSKYQDFKYHGYVSNYNFGTIGFKRTSRSSWYLANSSEPKIWTTYHNDENLRGANTITWSSTNPATVFSAVPDNLLSTKTNFFATNTKGGNISAENNVTNNITITEPVTANQGYKATNSITALSAINSDLNVNYQANTVTLKPGFSVNPGTDGVFVASTFKANEVVPPASNSSVYHVLLTKQTTQDHLSGIKNETSYIYDGTIDSPAYFGLQTKVVEKKYSGTTLQGTTTSTTTYENNPTGIGAAYYIGRPKTSNTTTTIYTGDTRTSSEVHTYTGNNLTKTEKTGHNTYPIVEDMTYDAVGNLLTKTVSAPTAPTPIASRTIADEYDTTKRFVIKKTDHQNFVTHFEYNALGQVKKSTNYLDVITDTEYDNWGKLITTKNTGASTTLLQTTNIYTKLSDGGYTVATQNNINSGIVSTVKYDVLGRQVLTTTKGFAPNTTISKQIVYDALGRKQKESNPYFSSPSKWTEYEYDYLQRPTKVTSSTGRIQTLVYNGLTTTSYDDVKTTTATLDALGNKVQTTDEGGTINFIYYANGQLKESNYEGHKVSIGIDGWGNKISMFDPNAGNYTYAYDAFGQITKETTPKGYTDTTYDNYGRLLKKTVSGDGADFVTDYVYNSFSQLTSESSKKSNGTPIDSFTYGYDNLHRLETTTESNANFTNTTTITYDEFGRPKNSTKATQELTTGLSTAIVTKNNYNSYNGAMDKMTDANDIVLWQLNTANEKMQSLTETLGNGVTITNAYNADGYYTSQKHSKGTTNILYNTYDFNAVKGTLKNRQNLVLGTDEIFTYDTLDRLTHWTNPLTNAVDSNIYDNRGRITTNNKLGTVNYNTNLNTGIYKKTAINLTTEGNQYYNNLPKQVVSYTMFKSPISINESDKGSTTFVYNSHLSRQTMNYGYQVPTPGATGIYTKTKYYTDDGSVEILKTPTTITIRTFIGGDAYSAPLYIDKVKNLSNGTIVDKKYYLHRDYLGSIIAISDELGVAVERRQFDAWGNLCTLQQNGVLTPLPLGGAGGGIVLLLDRGYTSHEHLAEVGLIHMNGRLYDPVLRSFLMPDNFIQQPENTQNYNRYGYVLNNPLMYNDPSGELGFLLAVGIGALVAATTYTMTALLADVPFSVGGLLKATFIGAASAAVTFGIGSGAESMFANFYSRAAFQALAHGTFQGGMTAISGGKFWSGFAAGALASIASSLWQGGASVNEYGYEMYGTGMNGFASSLGMNSDLGMIAFGTVAGAGGAALTKGNIWQGAVTGLVVSGLNHAMHKMGDDGDIDPPGKKKGVVQKVKETVTEAIDFVEDFSGGVGDFIETYNEMKDANWKNSDKYFHSKANFKASLRGPGGRYAAEKMSNLREITDQYIKGDSRASSVADQKANSYGRLQAQKLSYFRYYNLTYGDALPNYRPISLPSKH